MCSRCQLWKRQPRKLLELKPLWWIPQYTIMLKFCHHHFKFSFHELRQHYSGNRIYWPKCIITVIIIVGLFIQEIYICVYLHGVKKVTSFWMHPDCPLTVISVWNRRLKSNVKRGGIKCKSHKSLGFPLQREGQMGWLIQRSVTYLTGFMWSKKKKPYHWFPAFLRLKYKDQRCIFTLI